VSHLFNLTEAETRHRAPWEVTALSLLLVVVRGVRGHIV
jgi:hypothetical protein